MGNLKAKANDPGEPQWQPVLPEDLPKVEAFINDLTQHKEELSRQMQSYRQKPDLTIDDLMWEDYLNLSLNRLVFNIDDPFAGQSHQQRVINRFLANMATQHVADLWLDMHPTSRVARIIADRGTRVPAIIHAAFLYEIWPAVGVKFDQGR
jgi:hypothetical protein